jgi:hypothetical protein
MSINFNMLREKSEVEWDFCGGKNAKEEGSG